MPTSFKLRKLLRRWADKRASNDELVAAFQNLILSGDYRDFKNYLYGAFILDEYFGFPVLDYNAVIGFSPEKNLPLVVRNLLFSEEPNDVIIEELLESTAIKAKNKLYRKWLCSHFPRYTHPAIVDIVTHLFDGNPQDLLNRLVYNEYPLREVIDAAEGCNISIVRPLLVIKKNNKNYDADLIYDYANRHIPEVISEFQDDLLIIADIRLIRLFIDAITPEEWPFSCVRINYEDFFRPCGHKSCKYITNNGYRVCPDCLMDEGNINAIPFVGCSRCHKTDCRAYCKVSDSAPVECIECAVMDMI